MTSSNGSRTCTQNASAIGEAPEPDVDGRAEVLDLEDGLVAGGGEVTRDDEKDLNGIALEVSDLGRSDVHRVDGIPGGGRG